MAPHQRIFARADCVLCRSGSLAARSIMWPDDARTGRQPPQYSRLHHGGFDLRREKIANDWEVSAKVLNLFNSDAREPTFKAVG